jgi:hypothetical protein
MSEAAFDPSKFQWPTWSEVASTPDDEAALAAMLRDWMAENAPGQTVADPTSVDELLAWMVTHAREALVAIREAEAEDYHYALSEGRGFGGMARVAGLIDRALVKDDAGA